MMAARREAQIAEALTVAIAVDEIEAETAVDAAMVAEADPVMVAAPAAASPTTARLLPSRPASTPNSPTNSAISAQHQRPTAEAEAVAAKT